MSNDKISLRTLKNFRAFNARNEHLTLDSAVTLCGISARQGARYSDSERGMDSKLRPRCGKCDAALRVIQTHNAGVKTPRCPHFVPSIPSWVRDAPACAQCTADVDEEQRKAREVSERMKTDPIAIAVRKVRLQRHEAAQLLPAGAQRTQALREAWGAVSRDEYAPYL